MAKGRRHHGRSTSRNAGHVTRAAAKVLGTESPGRGVWNRQHARKTPHALFCEALLHERGLYRSGLAGMLERRGRRHEIYACTYGDHWLASAGPRHWHVGRPSC
jgi:hypothetical protein